MISKPSHLDYIVFFFIRITRLQLKVDIPLSWIAIIKVSVCLGFLNHYAFQITLYKMLNIHSRDIKTIYYKSIPLNITCLFLKSLIFLQEMIELLRVNFLLVHYIHKYLSTHLYTMCENITKLWSLIFVCILYDRGILRNIRNIKQGHREIEYKL